MAAAKKKSTRGGARKQRSVPLTEDESRELGRFVGLLRRLIDKHEGAVGMICCNSPLWQEYGRTDTLRFERALLNVARGKGAARTRKLHPDSLTEHEFCEVEQFVERLRELIDSPKAAIDFGRSKRGEVVARLARRLPDQGFKPTPPRFLAEDRDLSIHYAVQLVKEWMDCDDPSEKERLRELAESWTLDAWQCVNPDSLPKISEDEALQPFPRRAITKEDAPLVSAWKAKWERQAQLEEQEKADWARKFESAYKSDAVRRAGAGRSWDPNGRHGGATNAAYALVSELSGGSWNGLGAERVRTISLGVRREEEARRAARAAPPKRRNRSSRSPPEMRNGRHLSPKRRDEKLCARAFRSRASVCDYA